MSAKDAVGGHDVPGDDPQRASSPEMLAWAELVRQVGKREAIRLANVEEFLCKPRWHAYDVRTPGRMIGWLDRQAIDALCAQIARSGMRRD